MILQMLCLAMLSYEMASKTQARLDEEIAQLAIKLSSLQTRKNTFAPISRLPTPILARIFVCYASDEYYYAYSGYIRRFARIESHWIGVSYVCRHWRHVALTCPTLWSYLFARSPRWTEALLARSLDSPLRIQAKFYKSDMTLDFMAQLATHAERLEECSIEFELGGLDVLRALSMLSSRAPRLRNLCIRHVYWAMGSGKDKQAQEISNQILFNGDTPCLRELDFQCYHTPWYSPTIGGLTILRLHKLATSVRLTMAELMVILEHSPDLVELDLKDALLSGPTSSCQNSKKVRLPFLVRLLITAPLSEVFTFLSYVEIPSTTRARLDCYQNTLPHPDEFVPFYSFLSHWFATSVDKDTSSIPIRGIWIYVRYKHIHFSFSTSESLFFAGENTTALGVDFHPWTPLSEPNLIIQNIFQHVHLIHLKNINLENCPLSSTIWMDTFWHLPELRSIRLTRQGLPGLLEALSHPSLPPSPNREGPKGRGPRQVFAPSLEEIKLCEFEFDDELNDETCISMVRHLIWALSRRKKEAGRPLQQLDLIECRSLCVEDVEALSDVVGSVYWDGGPPESTTEDESL